MQFEKSASQLKCALEKEMRLLFDRKTNEISQLDPFMKIAYISLRNYVLSSGKRLRPIALIMSYKGVGGKNIKEITKVSLSVELLHASTLVHDDIMDEDDTRRNMPSMHNQLKKHFIENYGDKKYNGPLFSNLSVRFSVGNSIIFGNILQTIGAGCLSSSAFDEKIVNSALGVYNDAYRHVNNGQLLDIQLELKKPTEKDYFEMIKRKTGNLFVASVEIGALLGNAGRKQIKALKNYAENIAVAFQLQDDILDIKPGKGRSIGSDIRKGKKNLLIVKTMDSSTVEQKKLINAVLGKENATEEDISRMVGLISKTGALRYVKSIAGKKIKEAKWHLKNSGLSKESVDFFKSLADYMIKREK